MQIEQHSQETQRQAERMSANLDVEVVDMMNYTPKWQQKSTCKRVNKGVNNGNDVMTRFRSSWPDILTAFIVGICLAAFFAAR